MAATLAIAENAAGEYGDLRAFTPARIAQERAGTALATRETLAFALAHAQARDAVHTALDVTLLADQLVAEAWPAPLLVSSAAPNRAAYLARPDWGRRLSATSQQTLDQAGGTASCDLVFVLSDGLSATAVQHNAVPLLAALRPLLKGLTIAPPVVASQARVALADEVGALLHAGIAISLIGERPGLSSPDSLGAYLTHAPQEGRNDAERNCISNIRPGGLPFAEAAQQLALLIRAARTQRCSGVGLKL